MGLSNYPPGVTGNEPQIAGYPPCGNCGHEAEEHGCEVGDYCHAGCACEEYNRYPPGPDPDEQRDRQIDAEFERRYADGQ